MFTHYLYIEEIHRNVMESVIRQHSVVTEPYLAKLYKAAYDACNYPHTKPAEGFLISRIDDAKHVVATATDAQTGTFITLSGDVQLDTPKHIIVGQRWCLQGKNEVLSTTAVKIW